MVKVLKQSEEFIEQGQYAQAQQILTDGSTYERWMAKFGAQIRTGIAYCQLMKDQDTVAARETLAPMTEAQVADMPQDSYWAGLIYKVDEEISRLEELAQPDEEEGQLKAAIEADPKNLENYYELSELLIEKNRGEEAIPVLLDIIAIDRNWQDKKANDRLMEVFKKLGQTNEAVKKGRKRLANIMF